ncbi:hypothetical protein SLE2022_078380 [Rubroshorea leprosula]
MRKQGAARPAGKRATHRNRKQRKQTKNKNPKKAPEGPSRRQTSWGHRSREQAGSIRLEQPENPTAQAAKLGSPRLPSTKTMGCRRRRSEAGEPRSGFDRTQIWV